MENMEIVTNEEIKDVTQELATAGSGNGLKTAVVIGAAVGIGYGLYRLGKRLYAKVKAKKEQKSNVYYEGPDSEDDVDEIVE